MSRMVTRRRSARCTECDEFDATAKYTGAPGTPGVEEFDRIIMPEACPVCGAPTDIEMETVE